MIQLWRVLFLLLWCAPAAASTYSLELSEHATKAEAEAEAVSYGPEGEGMRVSRRFIRGSGWRYIVRLDGLTDRDLALSTAANLATADREITVYEGVGHKRRVVATIGQEAAPEADTAPTVAESLPQATQVLKDAVKAHGGRSGGVRALGKYGAIKFSFDSRTVVGEGEWKIRHHYYQSGGHRRLEVDMVKGDGISNTVVLNDAGEAWVATKELVRERDGAQAEEMMARFAPQTGLLSIPLGLASDIKEAAEWRGLQTTGRVAHRGEPHLRVVPDLAGDGGTNPLEAALFEEDSGLLTQVTWVTRGGRVTFIYGDYRSLTDNVVVPFSVRVERNGSLVEEIVVREFSLNPDLSSGLFSEPAKIRGRKH